MHTMKMTVQVLFVPRRVEKQILESDSRDSDDWISRNGKLPTSVSDYDRNS